MKFSLAILILGTVTLFGQGRPQPVLSDTNGVLAFPTNFFRYGITNGTNIHIEVSGTNRVAINVTGLPTRMGITNIYTNGVSVSATQQQVNIIGGTNITLLVTNNTTANRVDILVSAIPAGPTNTVQMNVAGNFGSVSNILTPLVGSSLIYGNSNRIRWQSVEEGWVFDEEFLGDATAVARFGREYWQISTNAGGLTSVATNYIPGGFGVCQLVVTNASTSDRAAIFTGNTNNQCIWVTNLNHLFFITKVYIGNTNNATDGSFRYYGLLSSVTNEPSSGIYFRLTNNIWDCVTASGGTRTVTITSSNVVDAMGWQYLAFDTTYPNTNVTFYIGGTLNSMLPVATNNANMPGPNSMLIGMSNRKFLGNTGRMTNYVDFMKIWVQKEKL